MSPAPILAAAPRDAVATAQDDYIRHAIAPAFRMMRTGADGTERFWACFTEAWANENGMSGGGEGQTWRLVANVSGIEAMRAARAKLPPVTLP